MSPLSSRQHAILACRVRRPDPTEGKERAQPLSLTDYLPHLGPHSLGPANLALVSPATAVLSTGLLGKDNILCFFF